MGALGATPKDPRGPLANRNQNSQHGPTDSSALVPSRSLTVEIAGPTTDPFGLSRLAGLFLLRQKGIRFLRLQLLG